jgi:hypothetical protein
MYSSITEILSAANKQIRNFGANNSQNEVGLYVLLSWTHSLPLGERHQKLLHLRCGIDPTLRHEILRIWEHFGVHVAIKGRGCDHCLP